MNYLDQLANTGRTRLRLTIAYFATFIGLGLTTGSLGPTLPALALQTNRSLSAISYLFTFRSLGYVLGSLRSGKLFDKQPGNLVMGIMLILTSISVVLVPLANNLAALLTIMFALGAVEASLDVGANTLLIQVHKNRVAPYMSAMHSCFGIGALLAPIILAQLTRASFAATDTYFVLALLLLPVAVFTLRLPSLQASNHAQIEDSRGTKTRVVIFAISLFLFLYVGAEVGFAGWIFTYAVTTKLGTSVAAAYLVSLFWGSLTVGRVLMIPIAARLKPEFMLVTSLVGALLSLATRLIAASSLLVVSTATAGLGLSMASIFPATMSLASRRLKVTGSVTGWFVVGASLGATTIPWLIGQVFSERRPSIAIVLPALALGTASVLLMVLFVLERLSRSEQHRRQTLGSTADSATVLAR